MRIIDVGRGAPIVVVPGVQGRWEWMEPAVAALCRRCRVITFSLADEPTSEGSFDESDGFSSYVRQVQDAMDVSGLDKAAICGVSYGGLIAAAFAARHPERVSSLVLVSALPPGWRPDVRVRRYLAAPRLLTPLFFLNSLRMYREIATAHDTAAAGVLASVRHASNVLTHMFSPVRMARRVRLLEGMDLREELARLKVRTLVITGEDGLDRVVPPAATREYAALWAHADVVVLHRTGHLGLITKAGEFARLVGAFIGTSVEPAQDAARPEGGTSGTAILGSRAS